MANTALERLSETSDVFFAISRARYDGFPVGRLPPVPVSRNVMVYAYMLGKYSLRWGFYRMVARICKKPDWRAVREVVNPRKDSKLREVATRHGIDPERFEWVGRRLRWVWPLLP